MSIAKLLEFVEISTTKILLNPECCLSHMMLWSPSDQENIAADFGGDQARRNLVIDFSSNLGNYAIDICVAVPISML